MPQLKLRQRLKNGERFVAAGVWDGMSAKIAQEVGFDMVAIASGHYNRMWAVADGSITPSQLVDTVFRIRDVVDIPILVDMEQGHGGPRQAAYWLRQLERAGADMVWVTDFPQLGATTNTVHIGKKSPLADPKEHAKIVKAMVDARKDVCVGARTWADAITGSDDAISRLKLYKDAGADMLWCHYPKDVATLRKYKRELKSPIGIQTVTPGYFPITATRFSPFASFKELKKESAQLIVFTGSFKLPYLALAEAFDSIIKNDNVKCLSKWLKQKKKYDDMLTKIDGQIKS